VLSHELRTPLSAILGWAHLLRRRVAAEDDLARGLDVIERNARAQTPLIEDLLDMNRIAAGKMRLDCLDERDSPSLFTCTLLYDRESEAEPVLRAAAAQRGCAQAR
jgi:signal transduction histidine kinase